VGFSYIRVMTKLVARIYLVPLLQGLSLNSSLACSAVQEWV
jgi:hypothetical protein